MGSIHGDMFQSTFTSGPILYVTALIATLVITNSAFGLEYDIDFSGIPSAETIEESRDRLEVRRNAILEASAQILLPGDDDYDNNGDTNSRLDSRDDVRRVVNRGIARILLDMPTDEVESIFLDDTTRAFGVPGSSQNKYQSSAVCRRDGDYDFALINLLRLVYIARAHPGRFSEAAQDNIIEKLLTVYGNDNYKGYVMHCGLTSLRLVRIPMPDTENHVLMTNVAQYLTNQLLLERSVCPDDMDCDNESNGNTTRMLEYLATFLNDMFYEYNSRPYQGYTVLAFELLHSHADDPRVVLATKMVLDMISAWTALQSNQLRRFTPFRRKPPYMDEPNSWVGNGEAGRLAFLVGNYQSLEGYNYIVPNVSDGHHASYHRFMLPAVASSYRMDDVLLDLALREGGEQRFFIGNHQTVEMYSSTASALISAGGHHTEALPISPPEGILAGLRGKLREAIEKILIRIFEEGQGWAQPTTLIPTAESSDNLNDMIRFEGHRDKKLRENLCVGPGFACGLSPELGDVVGPVVGQCSVQDGDWRFFDFSRDGCPLNYGFHLAFYERPCDGLECRLKSESKRYGLLEIVEATAWDFDEFRVAVLGNNPDGFASTGVHTYHTVTGHSIDFEIVPRSGKSNLVALDGQVFDRDYRNWARARGDTIQATTPGRITLDSPTLGRRVILDVTDPMKPMRFSTDLPPLHREKSLGGDGGRFFDDGGAVIPGQGVEWVAVSVGERVDGLSMGWHSGLKVSHGQTNHDIELFLAEGEIITEVSIGVVHVDKFLVNRDGIGYLRIRTNLGNELEVGDAPEIQTFRAEPGQQIVAFHGRVGDEVDRLGVIMAPLASSEEGKTAVEETAEEEKTEVEKEIEEVDALGDSHSTGSCAFTEKPANLPWVALLLALIAP